MVASLEQVLLGLWAPLYLDHHFSRRLDICSFRLLKIFRTWAMKGTVKTSSGYLGCLRYVYDLVNISTVFLIPLLRLSR